MNFRNLIVFIGIPVSFFILLSFSWKLVVPFAVIIFLLFSILKSTLIQIITFNLDTHSLIDFYLKKRLPVDEKLYDKILKVILDDKNHVRQIYVKAEVHGGYTRVKVWKLTSEPSRKDPDFHDERPCDYREADFYNSQQMHLWEFSIADYLSESEYNSLLTEEQKKNSFVATERIVVEWNGAIIVYGEKGRFGDTFDYIRGTRFLMKEPKNVLLTTSIDALKKLGFKKAKDDDDKVEEGRLYRKGKNFIEYEVSWTKDNEIFGYWSYSIRNHF